MALTNGSFTDTITPGDGNRVYISKQHLKEIRDYLIAHFGKSGLNDTDPNLTHPIATATKPGFLSVADKALLDNLAANAGTVLSVSGQAPITSSGGTNPSIGISAATSGTPGSMSAADKTKLDTYPDSYSTI